ncbi:unnamed protein product [Plutella xylostella]|uniref:(diamondback moth) hypothetical protein n=1 Tax=Plutella xylostella TaxID=51655 RepID=A0A8S4GC39_PLUXY|nr:unnamed protein product [Plutella xylostella]
MEKVTSDITIHVPPPGLGARHGQAALLFLCMVLMFCMRANMSLAVVGMVAVQPQRVSDTRSIVGRDSIYYQDLRTGPTH